MKKEIVAFTLLLLILAGNIWNQHRLDELTAGLLSLTESAYTAALARDWTEASLAAEASEKRWLEADRYTHIFIRHTDIDALTEAFCDFRGAVAGQETGELLASYLRLKALLTSLRGMENLSIGSVF